MLRVKSEKSAEEIPLLFPPPPPPPPILAPSRIQFRLLAWSSRSSSVSSRLSFPLNIQPSPKQPSTRATSLVSARQRGLPYRRTYCTYVAYTSLSSRPFSSTLSSLPPSPVHTPVRIGARTSVAFSDVTIVLTVCLPLLCFPIPTARGRYLRFCPKYDTLL